MAERGGTGISPKEHEVRPQRRLVITGIGAITPLGKTAKESWENALMGMSGIRALPFDERFKARAAGQIDYQPENYFSGKELIDIKKRTHRSVQFSLIATGEALKDAGLLSGTGTLLDGIDRMRVGARIGTGIGGGNLYAEVSEIIKTSGPDKIGPFYVLRILPERVTSVPSIKFGLKAAPGTNITACATGASNIFDASLVIRQNYADVMSCGGAEATSDECTIAAFTEMGALAKNYNGSPQKASRPFDKDRCGFVPSEGAVILVLEEAEHALARGAHIYAELVGMWSSADAKDPVQPDPETVSQTIVYALDNANVNPEDVDLIVAHATATKLGDIKEIEALRRAFGDKLPNIPITAPKSSFGHLLGAAGALTAMIAIKAIEEGKIPPTINLENPDDEFVNLHIVRDAFEARKIEVAIVNAFGFGGLNTVLVFKKFQS